jgi:hypothetical protein
MNARRTVKVRCAEPTKDSVTTALWNGCGWTGSTVAITEHGTTTYQIDECPKCRGAIEPQEGGDHASQSTQHTS